MRKVVALTLVLALLLPMSAVLAGPASDALQAFEDATNAVLADHEARITALEAPTAAPSATPTAAPSAPPTVAPTASQPASVAPSAPPSGTPAPTPSPTPTPAPSASAPADVFIGPEVAGLPTTGPAWTALKAEADGSAGSPDLCNQDNRDHPGTTLAAALVYARTLDPAYKMKTESLINAAYPTSVVGCGNAILSLGRQLGAYVLAADYVGYRDPAFVTWLSDIRTKNLGGHGRWVSLKFTADDSSNNWGTFASASLTAADAYLGDAGALQSDWARFRGFTGDRVAYTYRTPTISQTSWLCGTQSTTWTPIGNCPGNERHGAITEDAWRSGAYPTISLTYVQEGMQGLALSAEILTDAGYDAWPLLQPVADFATRWNVWNASAVGQHVPWWYNERLDAGAPTVTAGYGRTFGYTDWLFQE